MHATSKRFMEILHEIGDLHLKKSKDYGRTEDPLRNIRASVDWGVPNWVGALMRLNDKVVRLQSLCQTGGLANESAEDSMRDIASYAIISLVLYEEEAREEATHNGVAGCFDGVRMATYSLPSVGGLGDATGEP